MLTASAESVIAVFETVREAIAALPRLDGELFTRTKPSRMLDICFLPFWPVRADVFVNIHHSNEPESQRLQQKKDDHFQCIFFCGMITVTICRKEATA